MNANRDPRRPIMVNAREYRRTVAVEQEHSTLGDTVIDVLAGIAIFAFLAAASFWLGVFVG